jgi:hypothetical protein
MTERPILFSGDMIRAILGGRKTQTRRPVKPQPGPSVVPYSCPDGRFNWVIANTGHGCGDPFRAPWRIGYVLWVRETWAPSVDPENHADAKAGFTYRADWDRFDDAEVRDFKWNPSILMPKYVCRLRLKITDVRVERVQAISDSDVIAEGVESIHVDKYREFFHKNDCHGMAYGEIWNAMYKDPLSWESNPWVWAITFERMENQL